MSVVRALGTVSHYCLILSKRWRTRGPYASHLDLRSKTRGYEESETELRRVSNAAKSVNVYGDTQFQGM